jgi:hypothetical protein
MILVVSALIIIPRETTKLIRIMHSQNANNYTGEEHHVIVYAQDNCDVSTFICEFFHGERLCRDTGIALVTTSELHQNTKELLANPQYGVRVHVLKGDLSLKATLKRAKVSTAEAAFLLTPKHKQLAHYHHVDAQTIVTALNLRTYNPNLEIFVQVSSHEHKITALSGGLKHVVCMQELKLGLLAQSCLYPGFITLISNLVYNLKPDPNKWKYNTWLREYDTGLNYNFYSDQNLSPLIGMTFTDAALYLFRHCQVTLLGIKTLRFSQTNDDSKNTTTNNDNNEENVILLLNPGRTYVIREGDVGLIMATHEKALQRGLSQHPFPTLPTSSSSYRRKTSNELHRIAVHEEHKLDIHPTDDATDSKQHDKTREAVDQNNQQKVRHQQRIHSKRSAPRHNDPRSSQHNASDRSSLSEGITSSHDIFSLVSSSDWSFSNPSIHPYIHTQTYFLSSSLIVIYSQKKVSMPFETTTKKHIACILTTRAFHILNDQNPKMNLLVWTTPTLHRSLSSDFVGVTVLILLVYRFSFLFVSLQRTLSVTVTKNRTVKGRPNLWNNNDKHLHEELEREVVSYRN